jgi:putative transposase
MPLFLPMPAVGFRFRAHAGRQTLGALKAQLRLACEIYNALRRADMDFHRRNGRGLTLTELRQLALDLRKRSEYYQRLRSQVAQGIADRFHGARRRFREGVLQARIRESGSDAGARKPCRPARGWRVDRDYNASLNILRRAGWEPPVAPVELRPLPMALGRGQGGAVKQEAPP